MNEQAKHDTGNAGPANGAPQRGGYGVDATPKRERNSTLVAAAPGVLIHRIGDDDALDGAEEKPRRSAAARASAPAARTQAKEPERRQTANAAPPPARGAIASMRVATVGPAYSLPRALSMAVQRAREAQPRLINMADASYAGAED